MPESSVVMRMVTGAKDATHTAFKTVDIDHAEIHNCKGYIISRTTTVLGASSWIDIQINADSTSTELHCKNFYLQNSGGIAKFEIMELSSASTYTTGSAALVPYNRKRNCTSVSSITAFSDPALVGTTTVLESFYIGSTGTNAIDSIGSVDADIELILNPGSTYIFRLFNTSANACFASMKLFWYED